MFSVIAGACLSYGNTVFSPNVCDSNSIIYSDETIYWTVGLRPIVDSIYNGATRLISTKPFSPEYELKLIEQYKVNIVQISTFSFILCLKNEMINKTDLSSVKIVHLFGSKWPSSLGSRLRRYFPKTEFITWYGMTEIGFLASRTIDSHGNIDGYQIWNNLQVKIVDNSGNRNGPGCNGEICFKVNNQFLGYLDDPIANAHFIDNDGFYRTGDIGHFDDNRNLFIEDRKKNVIDVFYFDSIIVPAEIEAYLVAMPDIGEACVVGIPVVSGEALPAAAVVLKPESKLTAPDIYNVIAGKKTYFEKFSSIFVFEIILFIIDKVPSHSKLRGGVYIVDSLPKTHNGKIVRRTILEKTTKMFEAIKNIDLDIQSYLQDIPDEFRKLI